MKRITEEPNAALVLVALSEGIMNLARDASMTPSDWASDSRIELARDVLIAQMGKREAAKIEKSLRAGDDWSGRPILK